METMTRQAATTQLLEKYASYYDVREVKDDPLPYLAGECDFHAHSEKYVLTKKAKLWQAESHEYVYLFSVPHLTEEIYRACQTAAYARGMEKVKPGPDHMYTYITAAFVCDSCDAAARRTAGIRAAACRQFGLELSFLRAGGVSGFLPVDIAADRAGGGDDPAVLPR